MQVCVNHASLCVKDFERYRHFFEDICGMTAYRAEGETPARHIWYNEGIQLDEAEEDPGYSDCVNHLGLMAEDPKELIRQALAFGCGTVEGKPHWVALPNGVMLEIKKTYGNVK